jgi:hypothetical protein
MPKWVVGYTEPGCIKSKKWKGFLKPNFELLPNWADCGRGEIILENTVRQVQVKLARNLKKRNGSSLGVGERDLFH